MFFNAFVGFGQLKSDVTHLQEDVAPRSSMILPSRPTSRRCLIWFATLVISRLTRTRACENQVKAIRGVYQRCITTEDSTFMGIGRGNIIGKSDSINRQVSLCDLPEDSDRGQQRVELRERVAGYPEATEATEGVRSDTMIDGAVIWGGEQECAEDR